jgi:Domain of unknown function (DUF4432)
MLQNQPRDKAVSIAYSVKALPYFTLWKNTAAEKDGYVTGLEPGLSFPYNRRVERKFGRVPKLAPGANHRVTLDIGLHAGHEVVQRIAERIAGIQSTHKPKIDDKPAKID